MRPFSNVVLASLVAAGSQAGGAVSFSDPKGDDVGPGTSVYPTNSDDENGSFDLTSLEIKGTGADLEIEVTIKASVKDPGAAPAGPRPAMLSYDAKKKQRAVLKMVHAQ